MDQPATTMLELQRADGGRDLWATVEAAQYARVFEHDVPHTDDEAIRMNEFVQFLAACAEEWEEKSAMDQAAVLDELGHYLTALGELELSVYATIIQGATEAESGETVNLPISILKVARDTRPTISIELPRALAAE